MRSLDQTDREILDILQSDGRMPAAGIAREVGLAASAVHERVRKLERRGVIRGYTAIVEAEAVGLGLTAFVTVRTRGHEPAVNAGRRLARIENVVEVHHVIGEDAILLKVRARDTDDLWKLFVERIEVIPGLDSTRTTVVIRTEKESNRVLVRTTTEGSTPPAKRP